MQEIKAATLGGHVTDVPALWKELLARDFVAFAGRLDKPKELAPLRAGPEWARIKALEASIKPAYAADLGKGLFFIARGRDLAVKPASDGTAKIELNQELFQVDLGVEALSPAQRDGGSGVRLFGRAGATRRSRFWSWPSVAEPPGPAPQFFEPSVGAIDLATLETTGPVRLGPPGTRAAEVVMGWSGPGRSRLDRTWPRGRTGGRGDELRARRHPDGRGRRQRVRHRPDSSDHGDAIVGIDVQPAGRADLAQRRSKESADRGRRSDIARNTGPRSGNGTSRPRRPPPGLRGGVRRVQSRPRAASPTRTSSTSGSGERRRRRGSPPPRRRFASTGPTMIGWSIRPAPESSRASTCWRSRPRRTRC